ncbi:MAG: EamA family transporter [Clostridiales bacterium]|nr:EamA family transporter [Clostridiales bacterium]
MKENKKVLLAYLAVCFFWGSTYLAIKIGVEDLAPTILAGTRFLIAGAIMLVYAKIKGLPFPVEKSDYINNAIVGSFMLLGANGLVVYAEQWVDSGVTSLMVSMVPIWIAIIELLILKTIKFERIGYIGLILGMVGVYMLTSTTNGIQVIDYKGVLLLMIATLLWSVGSVTSKYVKKKEAIIANIGFQMLFGGIGLAIASVITGDIYSVQFTTKSILAVAYLITFGSIIGFSSYIYVLQKWPATKAGTYAYVNPAVAVLLGMVFLNEPLTISMIFAMGIILFGVYLVQRAKIVRKLER